MAETFNKKEREKKKDKRRKDKQLRKENRRENSSGGSLENMIAYVDENGMLVDTPPDPSNKVQIAAEDIDISIPRHENEEIDPVIHGTISFYDSVKGYGFIKSRDGENFFMHRNNVSGEPVQGKKVRFEKEKGLKGWAAVKIVME